MMQTPEPTARELAAIHDWALATRRLRRLGLLADAQHDGATATVKVRLTRPVTLPAMPERLTR